jgi:hypothetical protein
MSRYILAGFENEELEQAIREHETFPLVRELCFNFNLRVLCEAELGGTRSAVQMCLPNGMAVGKVYMGKNGDDRAEYCYRTPYYKKDRGSSDEDKQTIRSVKVSSLIATLKRVKAIPSIEKMLEKKMSKLGDAIEIVQKAMGNTYKSASELQADEVQALLCAFLGESPSGSHVAVDTIKCKKVLDKYNEADRVRVKKLEEVGRFFHNPFYMIGADSFGHFIVGKVKVIGEKQYEIVEQFKRYKDITERDDLIPIMTMTKLAHQGDNNHAYRLQNGYIPVTDMYDENLDAVFFYHTQATHYDYAWMATPC